GRLRCRPGRSWSVICSDPFDGPPPLTVGCALMRRTPAKTVSARVVRSASERAYQRLRAAIVACDPAPGDRITEGDVAQRLAIGKTPVHEALRRLVHEGLVVVRPRQGYVVAPITLGDVEELCGLRLVVEPAAVELAAAGGRIDTARVVALERLCRVGYD